MPRKSKMDSELIVLFQNGQVAHSKKHQISEAIEDVLDKRQDVFIRVAIYLNPGFMAMFQDYDLFQHRTVHEIMQKFQPELQYMYNFMFFLHGEKNDGSIAYYAWEMQEDDFDEFQSEYNTFLRSDNSFPKDTQWKSAVVLLRVCGQVQFCFCDVLPNGCIEFAHIMSAIQFNCYEIKLPHISKKRKLMENEKVDIPLSLKVKFYTATQTIIEDTNKRKKIINAIDKTFNVIVD